MNIKVLGDTHLGREFINNVPLHRRGERERMVFAEFVRQLAPEGASLHVHMGDLFDKFEVSLDVLMAAADAYRSAASLNPKTDFIILRGNHDANRNLEAVSSFDVFSELVDHLPNIQVVSDHWWHGEHLFLGFHPVRSAREVLADALAAASGKKLTTAWGHWDVDLRSSEFNLIPTQELAAAGITKALTGHVHLPQQLERDGVDVLVVGSMVPFAHGEGDLYVTVSKAEIEANPEAFKDKCVRVALKPGEVWDIDLDCLQLQLKRPDTQANEIEVQFDTFNLDNIFSEAFTENDVPKSIQDECMSRWKSISSN